MFNAHGADPVREPEGRFRGAHLRSAKCTFIETKMIGDPLKSVAVARLANSIRPLS
jgi:hypothetical protein